MPFVMPELRSLHSADLDLQRDAPADTTNFGIPVQAMIGSRGEDGEESFEFMVCSLNWLARELSQRGYVLGRHYLFVEHWDFKLVWNVINKLCTSTSGESWEEVAQKLSRWGYWEFEDYRP